MAAAEDVLVSVFMELARIAVIIIYFKRFYPIDEIEWLKKKIIN